MTAPDAARGDAAQTWRVLVEDPDTGDGDFADVAVRQGPTHDDVAAPWVASGPYELDDGEHGTGTTPREAVLRWVEIVTGSWVAVEILAPGELSRVEMAAEIARLRAEAIQRSQTMGDLSDQLCTAVASCVAAIARAVAEEREAMKTAVLDEVSEWGDATGVSWRLEEIFDRRGK